MKSGLFCNINPSQALSANYSGRFAFYPRMRDDGLRGEVYKRKKAQLFAVLSCSGTQDVSVACRLLLILFVRSHGTQER